MDPNRSAIPIREISHRISLVFMLTLAAALLLLGRAETYVFDRARQVVTDMAAPLLEIASRPVSAARRVVERTDEYAYVFDENERLRAENARLLAWKEAALKLEAKVARYEALLNVQVDPQIKYVSGRVVSDNGGPFVDTVIVNIGKSQGVKSGDAVIDTDGVVGRIVATGDKAARVLLLTDLNSRIPVVIEPAHYKAVLAGDNTDWPKLEYLTVTSSVSPGDRVVTSGDGGLIPPGLPIGLVIQTSDGFMRVQTFADRDRLDFVRVLQYEFPTEVARQDPPAVLKGPAVTSKPVEAAPEVVAKPGAPKPATPPYTPGATPKPAAAAQAPKPAVATKPKPVKPAPPVTAPSATAPSGIVMQPIPDPNDEIEEDSAPPPSDINPGGVDTPGTE
ncbi:MAG: rod shape-determining protein MreC [Parvibaculum sp.]|uniref:rod shape-determining protein MreC n=1 Tax=Parvibaculum sp. TaxID=2024848 RepID=UPI0025F58B1E|nr:rod shape-determining protein MreC [Parvibaculum sp.]MCE9650798.1 rod shape-determining protein MreC [Parvibaculum sp.]